MCCFSIILTNDSDDQITNGMCREREMRGLEGKCTLGFSGETIVKGTTWKTQFTVLKSAL